MAEQEIAALLDPAIQTARFGHSLSTTSPTRWRRTCCVVVGIAFLALGLASRTPHDGGNQMQQWVSAASVVTLMDPGSSSAEHRVAGDDCEERWHNMACDRNDCHTCGERFTFLRHQRSLSWAAAKKQISERFPECRTQRNNLVCVNECRSHRSNLACNGSKCSTCGDRIKWLRKHRGKSSEEAHMTVANAFVDSCGACATDRCAHHWDNEACNWNQTSKKMDCSSCGERIKYVEKEWKLKRYQAKLLVGGVFPQVCGACAPPASPEGEYNLAWIDQFNDGEVNTEKWRHVHVGNGFGNDEKQYYTPRKVNSWVEDGKLKIRAKREIYQSMSYTSAKLESKQSFLYGRFSVRVNLAKCLSKGTWPAVYMLPEGKTRDGGGHYGPWPSSGEMDLLEHVGFDAGNMFATAHTKAFNLKAGTQIGRTKHVDPHTWHTFWLDWRPDMLNFGVDNESFLVFRRLSVMNKDFWPFDQPFYIGLNLAVGGSWAGYHGIDTGSFDKEGQVMEVDWVKVEQKQKAWEQLPTAAPSTARARPVQSAPKKAGCYFRQPTKSVLCGGPFTDWTRDTWGEQHQQSGESEEKCHAQKDGHDAYCKTKTTWMFVSGSVQLAPNKPGCYFRQPTKSVLCGGPFTDWTRDTWGEQHQQSGESEERCLAQKDGHDAYCKTKTTWMFVSGESGMQPGCYYKQPCKSVKCGGPFTDWNRDTWGEKNHEAGASELKCLARKEAQDMYCGCHTSWKFVTF